MMGNERWRDFRVCYKETDLWVAVTGHMYSCEAESYTRERIHYYRDVINNHITMFPEFGSSLIPTGSHHYTHTLVKEMYEASDASETGPMSAVAGAIAEYVCRDLISRFEFPEVVVENGGDIYMSLCSPAVISIFAGSSPLSGKIGLNVPPSQTPLAICCSSGTVGHSLSFGTADAAVIACHSGARADAFATAFCNKVQNTEMVGGVVDLALKTADILSVVIIKDDKVGMGGRLEVTLL
jgi:ApbE superfamily uncharacterized protein (UPF0280 family)